MIMFPPSSLIDSMIKENKNNQLEFIKTISERPPSIRDKVNAIEAEMKKQPQLDLRVENYFSLGIYARALYIPKDTILVGKIHKYPQLNLLMQGSMQVLVGEEIQTVTAPFIVSSPAGTKRIAKALSDCLWVTVHGTHLTDVDEIEQHFIAQDEEEFQRFCAEVKEGEKQRQLDLFQSHGVLDETPSH